MVELGLAHYLISALPACLPDSNLYLSLSPRVHCMSLMDCPFLNGHSMDGRSSSRVFVAVLLRLLLFPSARKSSDLCTVRRNANIFMFSNFHILFHRLQLLLRGGVLIYALTQWWSVVELVLVNDDDTTLSLDEWLAN